jgi:transposase InsO family protein
MQHPNARLTPRGRLELVLLVERGASLRQAAGACNVALSTAHRWVVRWRGAATGERASLVCLLDRSSRPHRSPRLLAADVEQRVVEARARTGWGPRQIAGPLGLAHQTVWKVLRRHGCSRPPRAAREAPNRYEWPCPGDLLHMDVCRYARFERPGHAVTGVRDRTSAEKQRAVGYDFAHAIVDDHSRLAYVELLDNERAETVTGFVARSLDYFARHGITASRLMTDNAFNYTKNRSLRELLSARAITHRTTRPYRPRTNGKVERFHQTMAHEWAYGMTYRSSSARAAALPHWIRHYNEQRNHSSLGNRPPISRVRNV